MDFEVLYKNISPKLTNYLVANGSEYSSACDIVQETFLRIWKRRDSLVDDPSQISGLAFTIAKNLVIDRFRKNSREVVTDNFETRCAPPSQSPHRKPELDELRERLVRALGELPPLLREAFTLFQIQELSIREIARRTNQTESSVKVRIFRAKTKLRAILSSSGDL